MRKLETKLTSHRRQQLEENVTGSVDSSKLCGDDNGKGTYECDNRFDSGYSSGLVSRDEFDSGTCLSSSSELSLHAKRRPSEKCNEPIFDSGLGIDSSGDLDLMTSGELLLPTCSSMTADLSWKDIVSQDQDGDSLLHLMIVKGIIGIIFTFINLVPRPEFLNVFNSLYQTPLHLAVVTHQPRVVRRLVVAGAAVDVRDHRGNTPLHLACQWGDLECLQALTIPSIESEVEEALICYPVNLYRLPARVLQLRNYEGETCVHTATRVGHVKILEFLFSCGADANIQDGKSGNTVFHLCVELRDVNLVRFLLRQSRACVNLKNYAGLTPLQMAWDLYVHRPDQHLKAIISLLKKNGATPPEATESDSTDSDSSEEDSDANDAL